MKKKILFVGAMIIGLSLSPSLAFSDGKHGPELKAKDKAVAGNQHNTSLQAQKIKQVLVGYSEAVSRRDIEKMGSFLTGKTFSVVEGKHINWGWQDYRDNHLKPEFSSERFKLLDYKISNIRVGEGHMLSYAVYDFELSYEFDGEKKRKLGVGTAILESTGDGWLIRHIHTS